MSLRVRVRLESWDQFEVLYTRNISRGGLFLKMSDPVAPGTQLSVDVQTPDGREVHLHGQVMHTVSPETAASQGRRAGVGVRFLPMTDDQRKVVQALLGRAREVAADGSTKLLARDANGSDDLEKALREELGELKERDYFEVLGIPHAASTDDVERGYLMQVKRWHPDAYQDEPERVRELVAEIFIVVQRARDELADSKRRERLRRRTVEREAQEAGEEQLFAENEAPDAPPPRRPGTALSVELTLAQRLSEDGKFGDARKLLSHALTNDPDNWALREQYSLAAGRAALQDADSDAAALHFEEALRVNPNSDDAIRELRGMKHKRRKARSKVLARLFGRKNIE